MDYIKLFILILIPIFLSCDSKKKQKSLEEENKLLNKELELSKTEKELKLEEEQNNKSQELDKIKFKIIEEFLPNNYRIVSTEKGKNIVISNLDNDKFQDAVVLIADSASNFEKAKDVRIAILTSTDEGEYTVSSMSGNLTSAFLYNNLSKPQIEVKERVISVVHQSMRHDYELKFSYEKNKDKFMLIGSEFFNYGNAFNERAGSISSNFLTQKRIVNLHGQKEKIIKLNSSLLSISSISDENIYDIIGSE